MKIFGIVIAKEVSGTIIILIVSFALEKILKIIVKKAFDPDKKHSKFDSRKLNTIRSLLCSLIRYIIWILALISLLGLYGVNTAALITSLGVISLVIGLAFQDILKDILAGSSILFENWYAVGDLVKIDEFMGTVISVGLKSTRLQAYSGEIRIISNRNISTVINYSLDKTLAVVDIPVSYETKLEKAEKILQLTSATLKEKIPMLVEEPEVWGVQELADSSVIFRIVGKCKPGMHFGVERQMKKEFKNALDKNGIKIPYIQIEVHNEK